MQLIYLMSRLYAQMQIQEPQASCGLPSPAGAQDNNPNVQPMARSHPATDEREPSAHESIADQATPKMGAQPSPEPCFEAKLLRSLAFSMALVTR